MRAVRERDEIQKKRDKARKKILYRSPVHRALPQDRRGDGAWLNSAALPHVCDVVIVTVFVCICRLEPPQAVLGIVEAPPPLAANAVPIEFLAVGAYPNVISVVGETPMGECAAPLVGFETDVRHDQDCYGT